MSTDHSRSRLRRTGTRTSTRFGETRTGSRAMGETQKRRASARRRWWRRVKRRITAAWAATTQAVTALGWFVVAVTAASVLIGVTLSWIEAWFVAVVGAVLLVIAIPFLIGSRAYRIEIRLDRQTVVAGGEVHASIHIENRRAAPALPAVAELPVGEALRELTIPFIGPHGAVGLPARVPAPRRGLIRVGPLAVSRRDPLSLLRREVTWPEKHIVYVHPATTPLPSNTAGLVRDLEGASSRRLTDSDLSFYAVREYAPGDAMRHVHWKSTAKTGTLMVRQYEESQTARLAVLFDARRDEYASDDEFELGVSVAASISVQAVREGRERFVASAWAPGRVRPSVDGIEELPSRDPQQLLNAWAELEAAPDGLPFEILATGLAHSLRTLSIVVIVTGSKPDLSRIRRACVAFPPGVSVLAVRCETLAEPRVQRVGTLTTFTVGALGDLPQLMIRSAS